MPPDTARDLLAPLRTAASLAPRSGSVTWSGAFPPLPAALGAAMQDAWGLVVRDAPGAADPWAVVPFADLVARLRVEQVLRALSGHTNRVLAGTRVRVVGNGPIAGATTAALTRIGARVVAADAGDAVEHVVATGEGHAPLDPGAFHATAIDASVTGLGLRQTATVAPPARPGVTAVGSGWIVTAPPLWPGEQDAATSLEWRLLDAFVTLSVLAARGDADLSRRFAEHVPGADLHALPAPTRPHRSGRPDWREAQARIDWARPFMPATAALSGELTASGIVRGVRIGLSDVLEPKTAAVALALAEAGAEVAVTCAGRNTDDAVAAAVSRAGIPVYASASAGRAEDRENALALLAHRPEVIVDDGASVIRLVHTDRPDLLAGMAGATEQTTSGVRPLREMARRGELRLAVVAGNDARTKSLFDNLHGTGQSVVFAVADLLGSSLTGADVVVAGYGRVGSGIARHAAALGARVTVSEVDPVAALQAAFAGLAVEPLAVAAAHADILISATGIAHTVTLDHLENLPEGAAVAVGGGVAQEIGLADAVAHGAEWLARGPVGALRLPNGRAVRILDDGNCINVSAAEGNPIEIMDLSFGVQLSAVAHLLSHRGALEPGVHLLPRDADDRVAAHALRAFGGALDLRTRAQLDFAAQWRSPGQTPPAEHTP